MKRLLLSFLVLVGCTQFDITNNNNFDRFNSPVNNTTGSSDIDSTCPAIDRVDVTVSPSNQVTVGTLFTLSATPRDARGNQREKECDDKEGIQWLIIGSCSTLDANAFLSSFSCDAVGTCSIIGRVANVNTDVISVGCV